MFLRTISKISIKRSPRKAKFIQEMGGFEVAIAYFIVLRGCDAGIGNYVQRTK